MATTMNTALCTCGSLLRQVRCCGLDPAALASPEANRHLQPLVQRAAEAQLRGDDAEAERLGLEALELSPGHVDLLWLLSRLREAAAPASAEALVARIVAIDPNHVGATQDLALRLLRRGAVADAETHARNAVRLAPDSVQSHNLLGMVLTEAHQPHAGEFHYRRVLELSGARDPILLANLAWCLKLQGRSDEARALYAESLAAAPDVFQTLLGAARLEEADRRFDRAASLLARAERVAPGHPSLRLLAAVLHGRAGNHAAALAVLDALAAERGLGSDEWLEKGRLLDRLGRHAEAFEAFTEGKRLAGGAYEAEPAADLATRLRRFFVAGRLATLPRAGLRMDTPRPVFILGFPRSGTTLVEQMLTAHPRIAAGDELPFLGEVAGLMPRLLCSPLSYPEALSELWMGDRSGGLDTLRDHYLQRVRQARVLRDGADLFTDKMPLNEFHLGLIALLFPAAKLIHVLRHPLDVVLSVLANQLTHGFHCAATLESAARHYALVSDLVAHYRAEMKLEISSVRYEDIVAHPEPAIRRMLDFLGVAFDAACLAPHTNRRHARTASYAQVTEPIYDRSRERWRHYRAELAPVIPILAPAIARLGYAVD